MVSTLTTILFLVSTISIQQGFAQSWLCSNISRQNMVQIRQEGKHMVICPAASYSRKSSLPLSGSVLRVTYLTSPGYLEIDDSDRSGCHQRNSDCRTRWNGYIPDIFNHLAEYFNFTYRLQYSRDEKFGTRDPQTGILDRFYDAR